MEYVCDILEIVCKDIKALRQHVSKVNVCYISQELLFPIGLEILALSLILSCSPSSLSLKRFSVFH